MPDQAGRESMGFADAVKTCLRKYADFKGRARRSEYWWFFLFVILVTFLAGILDAALFGVDPQTGEASGVLGLIVSLALFLPLLAAGWRRLQDSGRPGWYILIPMIYSLAISLLIPADILMASMIGGMIGAGDSLRGVAAVLGLTGILIAFLIQLILLIVMIWWLTRPSDPGPNAYGPPPV